MKELKMKITICSLLILLGMTTYADDVKNVVDTTTAPHWSGLPIWGEKAAELGHKLPAPIGISIYYNDQTVPYKSNDNFYITANSGVIGGGTGNSTDVVIDQNAVQIDGRDKSIQLRLDTWILPFLNVYGLLGHTKGNKDVIANTTNVSIPGKPVIEAALRAAGSLRIPIEYEAVNVGLGLVLAGQVDPFDSHPIIMTLVGAYAIANTTTTDNDIYTKIGAFKVGQRYDVPGGKLAGLLGVTYQKIDQDIEGSYDFRGTAIEPLMETVDYKVSLESAETINMAATVMYDFGKDEKWNVMLEYGFLNWDQVTFALGRRF